MTILIPAAAVGPLRQRLIDEMDMRRFGPETHRNYIRDVGRFAMFLGRSSDTTTAEEVRRFQIEQCGLGVPAPTMNAIVSALRFFLIQTLDRPDLARKLVRMRHVRKLPVVLSPEEVARLLAATTCLKHQAALSVAYGAGLRAVEVTALKIRSCTNHLCPSRRIPYASPAGGFGSGWGDRCGTKGGARPERPQRPPVTPPYGLRRVDQRRAEK